MRKVVRKNFMAWQAEDEEKWINNMSAQGWQLVAVGWFRYEFEKGEPNEYAYRLELLEYWPTHPKSVEYIQFVEDTGADCFASIKRWVYFRKKTSEGSFELFNDIQGKLTVNKRCLQLLGVLCCIELAYMPPALIWLFDHPTTSLTVIIGLNALLAVIVGVGFTKILLKRKALLREQAIVE